MTAMSNKKHGLGRGLEALLGQATARPLPDAPPSAREQLTHVPVDLLEKGKYQPRQDMREESLAELADSIRAQGVVQPIVVRPVGTPSGDRPATLRDHRRRTPLARGADGGPRRCPSGRAPRGRRDRGRDGADREHPAREPQSARRGAARSRG